MDLLAERSLADNKTSNTRWVSEWQTSTFEVTDGSITFVTLDTQDKTGTTQLRIAGIERVEDLRYVDPDPVVQAWRYQGYEKLGTFTDSLTGQEVIDPVERFKVPLAYDEGVEGVIAASDSMPLTLNIYDGAGNLDSSYTVGSRPVGFSFKSDTFNLEVLPSNTDSLTEYSISWTTGQVYEPW
ncbi:MAG: hypothetical protein QNJ54_31880 [Prochloraceae cyanobacterium]|nr:hypothetical protein [Prochloraceae cyanobacterium]